jgi:hypothetical protein
MWLVFGVLFIEALAKGDGAVSCGLRNVAAITSNPSSFYSIDVGVCDAAPNFNGWAGKKWNAGRATTGVERRQSSI